MGKVYHASYSGYFPYCLNNPETVEYYNQNPAFLNFFQFRGSLAEQMYFWWVVKKIRVYLEYKDDEGGYHTEEFFITKNSQVEEQNVCDINTWNSSDENYLTIGYNAPFLFGTAVGVAENVYLGNFNIAYSNPATRVGLYMGQLPNTPAEAGFSYYNFNIGKYIINTTFWKTPWQDGVPESQGEWIRTDISAVEWFSYGETWNTSTGQLN